MRICLLAAASGALLAAGCKRSPAAVVTAEPAEFNRIFLSPGKQLPRRHEAETRWFFHCFPQLDYKAKSTQLPPRLGQGRTVECRVTVRHVNMHIGLTVQQLFPPGAGKHTVEHEEGHAQICKRIYAQAKPLALRFARQAVGKEFTASGGTPQQAQERALKLASESICRPYSDAVNGEAVKVSAKYEVLTGSGTGAFDTGKAVDEAFAELKERP